MVASRTLYHAGCALVALSLAGCTAGGQESAPFTTVEEISSPAAPGSAQPNLAAAGQRVYLSWLEPQGEEHALRLALRENGSWSQPRTVARGANFFVNWADFPSVAVLPDGALAAHWLVRSGPRSYDYDVHIALSADGGRSWSQPVVPHRDGTHSEHGFVSLFAAAQGGLAAAWLDGRETVPAEGDGRDGHGSGGSMTLRYTTLSAAGALGPEVLLDDRTCECCQTAAAVTSSGPVVVYRDRSPEEVRDIYLVRYTGGTWSQPQPVHRDGWEITGCPVNGPAIAAAGEQVAVAWFTAAQESPRVQIAFSEDAGASFGSPIRVDDGDPAGRAAVALLDDGSALVSWLERVGEDAAVRVRRVQRQGESGAAVTIAASSSARASGFPRMLRVGDEVIFAWTDPGESGGVRVSAARLRDF
ncbi:MAG TPA: sialidase family protein [Longimicrobiaceae bacterium]|nr:sialidase family protein [Longimicrobiaceae bacterium]